MSPALQADSLPAEPQGKPPYIYIFTCWILHNGLVSKESACNAGGLGLISWVPQENSTDRGAWWVTVDGLAKELEMTEQ